MIIAIPDVLTSAQVAEARHHMSSADWVDGRVSDRQAGRLVLLLGPGGERLGLGFGGGLRRTAVSRHDARHPGVHDAHDHGRDRRRRSTGDQR
ncbi:hypothetical protein B4Q13_17710 [Lacticaseibacillus rhamnosus]